MHVLIGVWTDPEGILASIPTVLTTFIGMHFGNVLIAHKVSLLMDHDLVDYMSLHLGRTRRIPAGPLHALDALAAAVDRAVFDWNAH